MFLSLADHTRVTFRDCRRFIRDMNRVGCIGGQMFWQEGEPQWSNMIGLIGTCTHCGWQVFTMDLLQKPERGGRYAGRHAVDPQSLKWRHDPRRAA